MPASGALLTGLDARLREHDDLAAGFVRRFRRQPNPAAPAGNLPQFTRPHLVIPAQAGIHAGFRRPAHQLGCPPARAGRPCRRLRTPIPPPTQPRRASRKPCLDSPDLISSFPRRRESMPASGALLTGLDARLRGHDDLAAGFVRRFRRQPNPAAPAGNLASIHPTPSRHSRAGGNPCRLPARCSPAWMPACAGMTTLPQASSAGVSPRNDPASRRWRDEARGHDSASRRRATRWPISTAKLVPRSHG